MTDSQSAGKKGRHKLSSTLHTKHWIHREGIGEIWQLVERTTPLSSPLFRTGSRSCCLKICNQEVTRSASELNIFPLLHTVLRIRDVYPGSRFLSIPDLSNFIFKQVKKICSVKTLRSLVFFTQKFVISYQKYGSGIRDPKSGKKPIPDPGSRPLKIRIRR
jgi:hypothetical protein